MPVCVGGWFVCVCLCVCACLCVFCVCSFVYPNLMEHSLKNLLDPFFPNTVLSSPFSLDPAVYKRVPISTKEILFIPTSGS